MKTKNRKNLGELFEAGEVECVDPSILNTNLLALSDQVDAMLAELPWGMMTPERRTGRPSRGQMVEKTSTRSIRFPTNLWEMAGLQADKESLTVNRLLELSLIDRIAMTMVCPSSQAVPGVTIIPVQVITGDHMKGAVEPTEVY